MPPPVVLASSPVQFVFKRKGGAVVHARLSVWSGAGTPSEKRVLVLFFEDSLDAVETFTRELDSGTYSCVLHVFVREDLHGKFDYLHSVGTEPVAADSGNVQTGNADGEGLVNRHDYVLSID
jgi:hypothetical protein